MKEKLDLTGQRWTRARDCGGENYEEVVLKQGLNDVMMWRNHADIWEAVLQARGSRAHLLKPHIDTWTLEPQPDHRLPCLQPLPHIHWTSPLWQVCTFALSPLTVEPFLFFLGWNRTSEPRWNVIKDPATHLLTHPHSSWFFLLRSSGRSHIIASSALISR